MEAFLSRKVPIFSLVINHRSLAYQTSALDICVAHAGREIFPRNISLYIYIVRR